MFEVFGWFVRSKSKIYNMNTTFRFLSQGLDHTFHISALLQFLFRIDDFVLSHAIHESLLVANDMLELVEMILEVSESLDFVFDAGFRLVIVLRYT